MHMLKYFREQPIHYPTQKKNYFQETKEYTLHNGAAWRAAGEDNNCDGVEK